MSGDATNPLLRCVRQLALQGEIRQLTDGQLLERFVQNRDEAAFENTKTSLPQMLHSIRVTGC